MEQKGSAWPETEALKVWTSASSAVLGVFWAHEKWMCLEQVQSGLGLRKLQAKHFRKASGTLGQAQMLRRGSSYLIAGIVQQPSIIHSISGPWAPLKPWALHLITETAFDVAICKLRIAVEDSSVARSRKFCTSDVAEAESFWKCPLLRARCHGRTRKAKVSFTQQLKIRILTYPSHAM